MAFAADYLLLGNEREEVRVAGNAVTHWLHVTSSRPSPNPSASTSARST